MEMKLKTAKKRLKIMDLTGRLEKMKALFSREKVMRQFRDWKRIMFNPRLLLCLFIAWMITNGWSYIFFGLGTFLKIGWMQWIGGAYLSLLWLPFTP